MDVLVNYARIGIDGLAGRFGILSIIVIKSVLNNWRYTPPFTIIMHETPPRPLHHTKMDLDFGGVHLFWLKNKLAKMTKFSPNFATIRGSTEPPNDST